MREPEHPRTEPNDPCTSLFEQYSARIFTYFQYRCGDAAAAQDLTMQVFERILRSLPRYDENRAPISAWLFSIARHVAADWQRRQYLRKFIPWDAFTHHPSPDLGPEQAGDFSGPTFWYGDLYAGGYLLGRVDFGLVPGGEPCDRSPDGALLAFTHTINDQIMPFRQAGRLSLLDLRDAADVRYPAPEIVAIGELSWSPAAQQLAVFGCEAGAVGCGLYRFNPADGSVRQLVHHVFTAWRPIWSPDGSQIAFVTTLSGSPVTDKYMVEHTLYVVNFQTGEIVYQGPFDADSWQVPEDSPVHAWGAAFPRELSSSRCFDIK